MSLLIKALASAEKDKLAEQDKKQSGEYVVDDALTLELAPTEQIELGQAEELTKFIEETSSQKYEEDFDFVLPANHASELLALEEEAGLDISELAPIKQSRPHVSTKEHVAQEKIKPAAKISTTAKAPPLESSQKAAAKVFVANQSAQAPTSKMALAILGIVGALMIWLGLQGYNYLQTSSTPEVVIAKPVIQPPAPPPENPTPAAPPKDNPANNIADPNTSTSNESSSTSIATINADATQATTKPATEENATKTESGTSALMAETAIPKKTPKRIQSNNESIYTDRESSRKNSPIKLVSRPPSSGVDPTLLSAYQAFTRGEDTLAQQQYRQVLQHDIRNTDALLGMAAIAQRQGRNADAMGWYQKVLEIEPKNTIAQSAIASPEAGTDAVATESRIKNMLAQQPESAHLHAALGNLYAEQNQWASAQEAYFNASRYAPNNADYTFNLAISLDQLGKSSLALTQYQRALEFVKKSNLASPDRAVLEARIQALQ